MRSLRLARCIFVLTAVGSQRFALATVADDLCLPTDDPCTLNTSVTLDPGSTIDLGGRALQLGAAARVVVGAGPVTIHCGNVELIAGARITGSAGAASSTLEIDSTGSIQVDAVGSTRARIDLSAAQVAGLITLNAQTSITQAGDIMAIGTNTEAGGGDIILNAATGDVVVSGALSVSGGSDADGGTITVMAGGKVDLMQQVDISGGEIGGGELDVTAGGDAIARQQIKASGGGLSGDGGSVFISAGGTATVLQTIDGTAAGSSSEGGGSGGDIEIDANQDVVVSGQIDVTGGFPDGDAGTFSSTLGGNFTQTNTLTLLGNGVDGCGGAMDVAAGRDVTLGRIELSGGSCGAGDLSIQGLGTVTVSQLINADGTTNISSGGFLSLQGRDLVTNGVVRANGGSLSPGGMIGLQACNVTVNTSSDLRTFGTTGSNLIQASGKAIIRGNLLTAPAGTNRIEYRDPAMPPMITGTITPAAVSVVNPLLPPCPPPSAACGDGTLDPGEQCDDGNNTACDGCGAACQIEACGNGRVECAEECDAGPLNGQPGSGCDATCKVVPLPGGLLLFPGGQTRNSCMAEWQIKVPNGKVSGGFPLTTQSCIDGDPACDLDGTIDGKCAFQVAVCADEIDARLPSCNPIQVASISINRPSPLSATEPIDMANATTLVAAIKSLGVTVKAGTNVLVPGTPITQRNDCTATFAITVPHPAGLAASKTLNIAARDGLGARMRSNAVTVVCAPNTAVCGNGVVEVGEQCDDGNHVACDGCAPTCRLERCGDGIVECSEECDDGAANGTPGSKCTSSCTEVVPPLRIPGGGSKRTDCQVETSLDIQNVTLRRDGTPSNRQLCVDNDPSCDFDPNPGSCQFHLWLCFGGADDRIACAADSVASVDVRRPRVTDQGNLAALRQALIARLGQLSLPTPAGEVCTRRVDVDVAAGKQAQVALRTLDAVGDRDSDSIKLRCNATATP
jgi:cysteine-rich repeat protein